MYEGQTYLLKSMVKVPLVQENKNMMQDRTGCTGQQSFSVQGIKKIEMPTVQSAFPGEIKGKVLGMEKEWGVQILVKAVTVFPGTAADMLLLVSAEIRTYREGKYFTETGKWT